MRVTILIAAAAMAGCSPAPDPEANSVATGSLGGTGPVANEAAIGAPAPTRVKAVGGNEAAGNATASEGAAARFVGRWAAKPDLCENGAWHFEERKLATAGEVSCDFERVTHVADGYDVAAKCLAEGATSSEVTTLRFPDGGDARMSVESKTFRPITLGRCAG